MKPTQKQRILQHLKEHRVVCGAVFLQEYMPRYAARILELRDDGYNIVSRPCTQHRHKQVYEYELVREWVEL